VGRLQNKYADFGGPIKPFSEPESRPVEEEEEEDVDTSGFTEEQLEAYYQELEVAEVCALPTHSPHTIFAVAGGASAS
jgi:hypothetical protein